MIRYIYLSVILVLTFFEARSQQPEGLRLKSPASKSIVINQVITTETTLKPFTGITGIDALAVSGSVKLENDNGYVRLILHDKNNNVFLVMEVYPLLCNSDNSLNFNQFCFETGSLQNIQPAMLSVEINDAKLILNSVEYTKSIITKSVSEIESSRNTYRNAVIDWLNKQIQEKGFRWIAGETELSKLSFLEKTEMFGGKFPKYHGLEYYVDGIFEYTKSNSAVKFKSATTSTTVSEFLWTNRHWQNWMTPVKNQGNCGSCWAFAATGTIEAVTNLYFNRHLDLDLSEQYVLSCSGAGTCNGGFPEDALLYIKNNGIINEACFPYDTFDLDCSEKCAVPGELIKISDTDTLARDFPATIEGIKKAIMHYGPLCVSVNSMHHAMTLAGFTSDTDGSVIWVFKNSHGLNAISEGYLKIKLPISDISRTFAIETPIYRDNYPDNNILCADIDGDGYFSWGIGPKPSHCATCPDLPDSDDSDVTIGPMDEGGVQDTLYSNCQSSVVLTNLISGKVLHIRSGKTITAGNSITNQSKVHYGAPQSVKLTTGFKVAAGCNFIGDLKGCSSIAFKSGDENINSSTFAEDRLMPEGTDKAGKASIYPNPAKNILFVDGLDVFDIYIIDLSGRKVLMQKNISGSIDISGLREGAYSVHICGEGNTQHFMFIKQ